VLKGSGKLGGVSTAIGDTAVVVRSATTAPQSEAGASAAPRPTGPTATDVTISFPHYLDSAAAEQIRGQLLFAIDSQCETIRFDLQATRDLDVQGLAFLAAVPRHLALHGRSSVQLAGVSTEMATVLRVTGLAQPYGIRR
jgi:anti-anti-sigma regulatory factor